jgi:hypothetical protein
MKIMRVFSIMLALALIVAMAGPAYAQLGTVDKSQIKIQNVSGGQVSVTVQFVTDQGVYYTPTHLKSDLSITNPFTLNDAQSITIDVSDVPNLPSGSYSVVISSTGKVIATASVFGESAYQFSGAYPSFSTGATTIYLPTINFNYASPPWYSMISVMNVGTQATDVTVSITCANVALTGTLSKTGLAPMASVTWPLKNIIPTGFTASTVCQGSATITAAQPIVAVSNQNKPATGATNSFESVISGAPTVYVPQLQNDYSGWNSALNVLKQTSGTFTITVDYSDAEPDDTCTLTNSVPSCQLFMPTVHPTLGRFSAIITSNPPTNLLVSVGQTKPATGWSGGYVGFAGGSHVIAAPLIFKSYFGWTSAINCMNVSATPTTLNIAFEGYTAFNDSTTLNQGASIQIFMNNVGSVVAPYAGSVVITANATNALIACMIGSSNSTTPAPLPGDYNLQYNAQPK